MKYIIGVWNDENEVFGHQITVQIENGIAETWTGYEETQTLECVREYIVHYNLIGNVIGVWDADEMEFIAFWNPETFDFYSHDPEYTDPVHGKIVDYRQEAYHDVHVYEDGFEERFYIGD